MSTAAVHSPAHIINMRRKKSLKKLTVSTETANSEMLPVMEATSPGQGGATTGTNPRVRSPGGPLKSPGTRSPRTSGAALKPKPTINTASASSSSSSSSEHDLSKLASPATPSRSGERKHVDSAIIAKLQKLGMQESQPRNGVASPVKGQTPKSRARLCVVLDMDECMLHTTSFSEGDTQRYRQEEDRPTLGRGNPNQPRQVTFKMFDGCRGTANLRPHLPWFLDKCTAHFDTYVFTAGTEAYASPLLDLVDPERRLKGRFYRTSCRRVVCELGELYLKDLSSLPLPQPLSRMVLVDNNPVSFLVQPCNGIPVVSWYDNVHDVVLKEVFDILKTISRLDDVRTKLDTMFGLKSELKALRRTVGLKNAFEPSKDSNTHANATKIATKKSSGSLPPVTGDAGTSW